MRNMIKSRKKTIIIAVALCMLLGGMVLSKLLGVSFANNNMSTVKVGNGSYMLKTGSKVNGNIAVYLGPVNSSVASVTIPDTIEVKGTTYSVTEVCEAALQWAYDIKKLTIGKNISYIEPHAFEGCKNLKSITVKTPGLTKKGLKKNAFAKINKKVVVTVPESKVDDYKKLFKTRGLTGKKQTVKGKRMECDVIPEQTFGADNTLQNPEQMLLSLGNDPYKTMTSWKASSADFMEGDIISFRDVFELSPEIYGMYLQKPTYGEVTMCNACKKRFSSEEAYAMHIYITPDCYFSGWSYNKHDLAYIEDYWMQDKTPCRVELCLTLPESLHVKEDSLRLGRYHQKSSKRVDINKNAYNAKISGDTVIFTIDNIKSEYFSLDEYDNIALEALFEAEVESTASSVSTITSSIHYSYKGLEKTAYSNPVSIYMPTLRVTNKDQNGNVASSSFTLYRGEVKGKVGLLEFKEYASGTAGSTPLEFKHLKAGKYRLVNNSMPPSYLSVADFEIKVETEKDGNNMTGFEVVKNSDNPLFTFHTDKENLLVDATFGTITD